MLRFCLLGSGSSGNAILIATPTTKVLIDSGLSCKQIFLRAAQAGLSLDGLNGIFITHEHSDHVSGLGVLARKTGAPVYITEKTHAGLPVSVGDLPLVRHFDPGETVIIDGVAIHSFSVCHDAVDPVCYVIESGNAKMGIASDLRPGLDARQSEAQRRACAAVGIELLSRHAAERVVSGDAATTDSKRYRPPLESGHEFAARGTAS